MVALVFRSCTNGRNIAARTRLSDCNGQDMFAGYAFGQPALFLLLCSEFTDIGPHQPTMQGHVEARITVMCHLLDQDLLVTKIGYAGSAVLFICPHKQHALLAGLQKCLAVDNSLRMPAITVRSDFVCEEITRGITKHRVFVVKYISVHCPAPRFLPTTHSPVALIAFEVGVTFFKKSSYALFCVV